MVFTSRVLLRYLYLYTYKKLYVTDLGGASEPPCDGGQADIGSKIASLPR
jgi:hypothetical protein